MRGAANFDRGAPPERKGSRHQTFLLNSRPHPTSPRRLGPRCQARSPRLPTVPTSASLPERFGIPIVQLQQTRSALSSIRLRCPDCRDVLTFQPTRSQPLDGGAFGLLTCSCSTYPVLDSIPVIRHDRVDDQQDHMKDDGPTVSRLVGLLKEDKGRDALVEMLSSPPPVPLGPGDRTGLRLPFIRGSLSRAAAYGRRREVSAMLANTSSLTAQDWMELGCHRSSDRVTNELFAYFFARFGQPRLLATMSLLQALPNDSRPVLELACGYGHVMFHLAVRESATNTVGLDRNFFQLWVGRRYVAPGQTYICSDRLDSLPFDDDSFAAAVCEDAFHLFDIQQEALDEMRRVAQADTVILDRIANAGLEPRYSDREREPAGYVELLRGAPWRMVSEAELIAGYLADFGPQLEEERKPEYFELHKWLSLVSSRDSTRFVDHHDLDGTLPPHVAGQPTINPLFRIAENGNEVLLTFSFPSTGYALENAGMLSYTSARERLPRRTYENLLSGDLEGLEDYVDRFVVVGMPPKYTRPPATRATRNSLIRGLLSGMRGYYAPSRR